MASKASFVLALALACAAANAMATTPTVADLDAVQAETVMLRAQAAKAKAAQELDELRGSGNVTGAADAAQLPTARGLFGANGTRYVVFLYPNGGVAEGEVGDSIPGGYRVLSFDSAGVHLRGRDGARHRIPFSMKAPTAAAANGTGVSSDPGMSIAVPVSPR